MVLQRDDKTYSRNDWELMRRAYCTACRLLNRDPATDDEGAKRLARDVLKLFDCGVRDEWAIAVQVREAEYANPSSNARS